VKVNVDEATIRLGLGYQQRMGVHLRQAQIVDIILSSHLDSMAEYNVCFEIDSFREWSISLLGLVSRAQPAGIIEYVRR